MGNIVKFSTPVSVNSIKSGGFNMGVNGTPADLTGFYTGICPINGGYTIYINKASNGPSIYAPGNDTQLINITKGLGGNVSTATGALTWINSQSNMTVANSNYPSIVTSGLVMNLDAGFVSSYPRTGTSWKDLSGNGNNSILYNTPAYSSDGGGAIVLDGVDDYAQGAFTAPGVNIPWSMSCIFKAGTQLADNGLICLGFLPFITLNANGNVFLFWWNGVGYSTITASGTNYGDNAPHNVTATYDGVTVKLYVDSILKGSNVSNVHAIYGNVTLGKEYNNGPKCLNGTIYYGSVYNRALSADEVLQNYQAGLQRFIPTNGLILSLDAQNTNLYATSATTAYDISGNGNNGALINSVQYVGDVDGSWRFDATDDRIYAVSNVLITNDFTFTVWAKRDGNSSTGIGGIFGNHIHTELSGANIYFTNNSTTVTMSAGNGVTRPAHTVTIPRLNTLWNFYVIMYSGTTYQLYFNGVLLDSRTATVVQSLNTDKYTLGVWALSYLSEYYLNGKISQCSTYNRALTATEISTIYNATKSRYGL